MTTEEPVLGARDRTEADEDNYHWMVLSVTSLGVLLMGLNTSTLNVALPSVVRHFHADPFAANWILLSYMLINTVLILVFGRLADIFGRRTLYLLGFVVFSLASLLLGLSPNVAVLIALRMVQAAGAALIVTNTTALITDVFPPRLLSQGLGLNVATVSVATLLGPAVGGFFAATAGWRWVFWFNVPLGAIGLIWGAATLRKVPRTGAREPIDVAGNILAFLAIGGLLLALSLGGVEGWDNPQVLVGIAAFVVFLPLFLLVEMRSAYPMVDLALFRNWTYAMANFAAFLNSLARSSPVLLIAIFLQAARGESPFDAGLRVLPVSIGLMVASPIAGALSRWYSARLLSTAGLGISAVGLLILAFTTTPTAPYSLTGLGLGLAGAGSGFFLTPNTTSIMTSIGRAQRGAANGLRSMLQNFGVVVSTALSLAIVTSGLKPAAKGQAYAGTLSQLSHSALATLSAGYRTAFLVMVGATLLAVIVSFGRGGSLTLVATERTVASPEDC